MRRTFLERSCYKDKEERPEQFYPIKSIAYTLLGTIRGSLLYKYDSYDIAIKIASRAIRFLDNYLKNVKRLSDEENDPEIVLRSTSNKDTTYKFKTFKTSNLPAKSLLFFYRSISIPFLPFHFLFAKRQIKGRGRNDENCFALFVRRRTAWFAKPQSS